MEKFDPNNLDPNKIDSEEPKKINDLLERMENPSFTMDEYRYLQYLLMKYEFLYQSNYRSDPPYPLCKLRFNGNKIMFISDTHRGNKDFESKRLIDIAYNEAIKQKINAVVHAGDFIEACPVDHDKKFEVVFEELKTAMDDLPNNIQTGLLLGNHDYSAIRTHRKIIPHYFNLPKIEILGMQKVLLNWNGQAFIRINHPISQLKEPEEENQEAIITIEGHHHYYDFKPDFRTINLPSLSKLTLGVHDMKLSTSSDPYCSIFVVAEEQGDNLLFHKYCVDKSLNGQLKISETLEVNTKTKQLRLIP